MHSSTRGAAIFWLAIGCSPITLNLSTSRLEMLPACFTARAMSPVGTLMANSLLLSIKSWVKADRIDGNGNQEWLEADGYDPRRRHDADLVLVGGCDQRDRPAGDQPVGLVERNLFLWHRLLLWSLGRSEERFPVSHRRRRPAPCPSCLAWRTWPRPPLAGRIFGRAVLADKVQDARETQRIADGALAAPSRVHGAAGYLVGADFNNVVRLHPYIGLDGASSARRANGVGHPGPAARVSRTHSSSDRPVAHFEMVRKRSPARS